MPVTEAPVTRGKVAGGGVSTRYAHTMVLLMAAAQVLNQVDRAVVSVAAPDLMNDLGLTTEQYGLLASAFYSLHSVAGIAIGLFLAHRVRPLLLVIYMIGLWTVTQLPPLVVPTLMVLLISRAILGAAESASMPIAVAVTHALFPADRRNLPTSVVWAGASIGAITAPPILTVVIANFGWRGGFLACAFLSGLLFSVILLFARRSGDGKRVQTEEPAMRQRAAVVSGTRYWTDSRYVLLTLIGFCAYWMTAFAAAWLFPMVRLLWGYSQQQSGWIVSGIFLFCTVPLIGLSSLSQRMLKRGVSLLWAVVLPAAACLFVSSAFLLLSSNFPIGSLKLLLLAAGMCLTPYVGTAVSVAVSHIAPDAQRNRLLVVILSLTALAGLPAPYVTGWLVDYSGGPEGYDWAILCCAGVTFSGGLFALALSRSRYFRQHADDER